MSQRRSAFPAALLALLLGGCASTEPARFYVLAPVAAPGSSPVTGQPNLGVGVGPVEIPELLNRPQIVTRAGDHERRLAGFDRWAEPLADNVAGVLAENLASLLASERVTVFPWRPSTPLDAQVEVEVIRLDADAAGQCVLVARWTLLDPAGKTLLSRRTEYRETTASTETEAVVAALSRALAALSRDVAAALAELAAT